MIGSRFGPGKYFGLRILATSTRKLQMIARLTMILSVESMTNRLVYTEKKGDSGGSEELTLTTEKATGYQDMSRPGESIYTRAVFQ